MISNTNSIQAIIFDMDGVLINTNEIHFRSFYSILKEHYNVEITGREFADLLGGRGEEVMQVLL